MNMKYYLILLISVFLSLGLGIIVGISLQSKDVLEKQHNTIAQRLEEEFVGIRNENRQLKENLSILEESEVKNKDLCQTLFDAVIKNRLEGLKVALIETGGERDFSSLISLLKVSGASIESSITFDSEIFRESQDLEDVLNVSLQVSTNKLELYDELAGSLIDSLLVGEYTPLIKHLNELNLIRTSIDIQNSCDAIVLAYSDILKNKDDNISKFSKYFVGLAEGHNIPIIVVENEDTANMDLNEYKKIGVSTIDHVNTIYGKLSLVSLLYGNKGNYGFRDGVEGVMPVELFPPKPEYDIEIEDRLNTEE